MRPVVFPRARRPALAAVLLLAGSTYAIAEPITITSGSLVYSRSNAANLVLRTPLELAFDIGEDAGHFPSHVCFDCTAGAPLNLSASETLSATPDFTFGGQTFTGTGLRFQFNGGTVRVPDVPIPGEGEQLFRSVTAPFRFTGELNGVSATGTATEFQLAGRGTARLTVGRESATSGIDWFATDFVFDSAAPVPEPPTIALLLASGAGMVVRRVRRRGDD